MGANKYLPIEVKYKEQIDDAELKTVKNFCERLKCSTGIVVTKNGMTLEQETGFLYAASVFPAVV